MNRLSFLLSSESSFSRERYLQAKQELQIDANTHYHTVIGRAAIYEIIATVLIVIVTGLTFWLATASRNDEV
jgi:hypothetical protein